MGRYTAAAHDHLVVPARALITPGQQRRTRLAGGTIPTGVPVRLLVDTGSRRSTLVPSVSAHLNPVSHHPLQMQRSAGNMETALFWVSLEFPGTRLTAVTELAVARVPMPPLLQAFHGLIGRDLLRRWESFLFRGRRGRFTIRDAPGLF